MQSTTGGLETYYILKLKLMFFYNIRGKIDEPNGIFIVKENYSKKNSNFLRYTEENPRLSYLINSRRVCF